MKMNCSPCQTLNYFDVDQWLPHQAGHLNTGSNPEILGFVDMGMQPRNILTSSSGDWTGLKTSHAGHSVFQKPLQDVLLVPIQIAGSTSPVSDSQVFGGSCVYASHSVVSDSATPWIVACPAPLSMGFSRQEYWSGFPFPSPRDITNLRIKLGPPSLQAVSLPSEPPGKPVGGS